MPICKLIIITLTLGLSFGCASLDLLSTGKNYHVSLDGDDDSIGSESKPFRTIMSASQKAMPGDIITVHEGVYREYINPPRGGDSDNKRIVYRAAKGEKVSIKGSELIKGWEKVKNDTWKVTIPNSFFGDFNPYSDLIHGDWFNPKGRKHHTGAVYLNGHWLTEASKQEEVLKPAGENAFWFAIVNAEDQKPTQDVAKQNQSDSKSTTIWAQFKDVDPNKSNVEINVRQSVFYPGNPGVNYLTVKGFTLEHAATPWAPPTAEQIGLIGTHWSKGWIIEDNNVRYSTCVGITLGKYGDQWDNTSADSAVGYVKTIERALENGWSKENIGHHIVRNNHVSHCEQAGIVGSLGPIFCKVQNNEIHDIHVRQLFSGAEMAGIKFHAAIDTEISGNHIYRSFRGIWLDWMTQGTRVTRNLLHDNFAGTPDIFVEVNHGPFLIDHNILLSPYAISNWSEGGAYVHNLLVGAIKLRPILNRKTPYQKQHSTELAGIKVIQGGDDRFFNNLFIHPKGLSEYNNVVLPVWMKGNVFLNGSQPSIHEKDALELKQNNPDIKLIKKNDETYLQITFDKELAEKYSTSIVTTEILGRAKIPDLPFVKPDGSHFRLNTDYFGEKRNDDNPFPGPFGIQKNGTILLKVGPQLMN